MTDVSKDDIEDGGKGCDQVDVGGGLDGLTAGVFDAQTDHTDDDGGHDTRKRNHGQPGHVVEGSGQGTDQRNDQAHDAENNGAGAMIGEDVERDGEGDQMAGHEEDNEEDLGDPQEFPTNPAHENLTGVGHAHDVGISELELAEDVTGVGGDNPDADEDDQSTVNA